MPEKTEALWVRVVRRDFDGMKDAVMPDVPDGVYARCDIPMEDRQGHTPGPLVQVCRIRVTPDDAKTIREADMEVEPSDADRAMVLACQEAVALRDPADRRYAQSAHVKTVFRKIAAAMQGTPTIARNAMKAALLVAVSRGLRRADAEDITREHGLSATAKN